MENNGDCLIRNKSLIGRLKAAIEEGEEITNPTDTLTYALSNARGTLSGICNPPRGAEPYVTDEMITRCIFNVRMAKMEWGIWSQLPDK